MDGTRDKDGQPLSDMVEAQNPLGISIDEFEEQAHIELHKRGRRSGQGGHVDLSQEEYTPEEIARMLGTSLEVVMHAIWKGELKAEKQGHDVVCVQHVDVVNWLRSRGPGI